MSSRCYELCMRDSLFLSSDVQVEFILNRISYFHDMNRNLPIDSLWTPHCPFCAFTLESTHHLKTFGEKILWFELKRDFLTIFEVTCIFCGTPTTLISCVYKTKGTGTCLIMLMSLQRFFQAFCRQTRTYVSRIAVLSSLTNSQFLRYG